MLTQHAIRTVRSTLLKRAVVPAFSSVAVPFRTFSTPPKKTKTPWLDFLREHTTNIHEKIANPDMFCRQCEQTSNHFACTTVGICGKTSETACIQDTLMQLVRSVGQMVVAANAAGVPASDLKAAHLWTMNAVFSTMTNVNFTDVRSFEHIQEGIALCKSLQAKLGASAPTTLHQELDGLTIDELEAKGLDEFSIPKRQSAMGNDDAFCLNELATYGLKGVCAYLAHSHQLGCVTDDIMMGVHQVHAQLNSNAPDAEGLLAACLKVGELNTKTLALLDEGHATKYGAPEPTQVRTTAVQGNCILVSGHDMVDLHALLEQTEGTGVNVYTHGKSGHRRKN
jgi:hydroxylamine reductase